MIFLAEFLVLSPTHSHATQCKKAHVIKPSTFDLLIDLCSTIVINPFSASVAKHLHHPRTGSTRVVRAEAKLGEFGELFGTTP
jgi:hypothetical protein